jgi:predicted aminopeptidase
VRKIKLPIVLLLIVCLAACASPGYYAQALGGQWELWRKSESIEQLLADSQTLPQIKSKLETVHAIRQFASQDLHLPDNGSYRKYADLKRPFVVWNVFAADEFSVKPREWCFMIVGCVGYRGYFSKEGAEAFAAELRAQGQDVYIGGVPAYSTLGYFDDPVLSTFIRYPDAELARLVFHELAHQLVYVGGDSTFNESFAVAVELEGVKRWIDSHGSSVDRSNFAASRARRSDYLELVETYRHKLETLYASSAAAETKRSAKAQLFQEMRDDYQKLKTAWGGFAGYDWIFAKPLDNAFIASTSIYTQMVPAFQYLLTKSGGNLDAFYASVKQLASASKAKRDAQLAALLAETMVVGAR